MQWKYWSHVQNNISLCFLNVFMHYNFYHDTLYYNSATAMMYVQWILPTLLLFQLHYTNKRHHGLWLFCLVIFYWDYSHRIYWCCSIVNDIVYLPLSSYYHHHIPKPGYSHHHHHQQQPSLQALIALFSHLGIGLPVFPSPSPPPPLYLVPLYQQHREPT